MLKIFTVLYYYCTIIDYLLWYSLMTREHNSKLEMIEFDEVTSKAADPILDSLLNNVSDDKKMTMYARIENTRKSIFQSNQVV